MSAASGDFARELEVARQLALDAGREILAVYATGFAVTQKPDDAGPVTQADLSANALILEGLRAAFPDDAVIAEESDAAQNAAMARCRRCWFVDPMDGTQEFVDRNGMFAVQIGLAVEGRPRVGVVYAPALRKLYAGVVGHGATLERADGSKRPLRVPPAPAFARDLRLCVSRSHQSAKTVLARDALGLTRVIAYGSVGLKAGLVAEGEADLYLHPGDRSYRWDSCAPEAVLTAAGGVLVDLTGTPYPYDGTELRNVRGLVGASPGAWALARAEILRIAPPPGAVD
ncbi:MAG: 3'(2'),5'-bisphosphate nucleotidase CysQ [Myxococcaceae bacterium]|nr:3'(2'),5'-bisphosphate nucleotidase CysQ [Myxococcaceae bacterium]